MIKAARNRILVRVTPASQDLLNPLKLVIVDKKKHFDHPSRKGVVQSVGIGVREVFEGDTVVFRGDAGYSMDYDPDSIVNLDEEHYRWLKESDCLAVEEKQTDLPPPVTSQHPQSAQPQEAVRDPVPA